MNNRLKDCVKIKNPGDSKFEPGKIVSKEAYEEVRSALEADDKTPPHMSNGPSRINENPRAPSSSCMDETPTSSTTP